ncbi:hypothetical protein B0J12DRAFT_144964 [Macrophomina phaseolina]|uniref:BTB/POZ-like protein n=1 Tax=Macrophomina phaseolina TaxID=35725 RepID=A0ABQ8G5Y6_9PEZI|nr:hypothetical protein B0J12DRAFT_144964 [Macrophomina phaseolina]
MPPSTADPARSTRTKSQAPAPVVPRIVPAIPLPFARAQRPNKPLSSEHATPTVHDSSSENAPRITAPADPPHPEPAAEPAVAVRERLAFQNGNDAREESGSKNEASAELQTPDSAAPVTSGAVAVNSTPTVEQGIGSTLQQKQSGQDQVQEPDHAVSREPHNHAALHASRSQRPPSELPPPFYPSTDRSTPTSTTSSTFTRSQPPSNPAVMHNSRPSANGIVFGGYPDSSSVSPAPPVTNGNLPYPPPPGPYPTANMIAPPYPFPGHAHHFSEPHTAMMPAPTPAGMPTAGSANFGWKRFDQPIPPHMRPAHSTPSPNAPNPGFSPVHPGPAYGQSFSPVHVNCVNTLSRSGSQASSPRLPVMDDVPVDALPEKRFIPSMQNGVAPRKTPVPVFQPAQPPPGIEFGLRDYMRSQFGGRAYADYVLKLYPGGGRAMILNLPVHGIILGRNRKFAELMARSHPGHTENGMRVLNVLAEDRFLEGLIFAEALKYLYSEDMLSPGNFTHGMPPFTGRSANTDRQGSPVRRMSDALAYAAAGFWLEIRCIVSRGLDIATELLRWDTVETALAFAVDGGLDSSWRVDDTAEDSSSDDASSRFDTDLAPTYGSFSTQFLQTINGFLLHNFPEDFELDTCASQLHDIVRLPSVNEPRPTSRNPRLSQIRFGEVPVEAAGPSQAIVSILSSILLSLPFPVLKALLEDFVLCSRLGKTRVGQLMHSIVEEREARRRKVLKDPRAQLEKDESVKQNLLWCERVEPSQHASGFRLARSRQDIDTPASSDKSPDHTC